AHAIKEEVKKKRAEEALKKSEAKYLDLYENANDIIFTFDLQGRFTSANKAAYNSFGYRKEEVSKLTLSDVLLPEDAKLAWERCQKMVASKSDLTEEQPWEYKAVRKDGSTLDIEVRARLLRENEQIVGVQGIARDITERKWAEEEVRRYALALEEARDNLEKKVEERTKELSESEEKYYTLFEHTGTATAILEEDTTISLVNKEFEKLSGYSKEEIEGKKSWTEFIADKDLERLKKYHEAGMVGIETPTSYELEAVDRERNIKNLYITIGWIPGTKKNVISLIDITELKRMEEKLLRSERLAAIGKLSASIAHELRQPLAVISNAVYYLKMRDAEADETTREYLNMINSEAKSAGDIISSLMELARSRSADRREAEVSLLIEEALEKFDIAENIILKKDIPANIPAIFVEPVLIERVFYNIINNAIQAMSMPESKGRGKDGELAIKVESTSASRVKEDKAMVEVSFSDTGVGISEENMKNLFEPLFTTKATGIGLGLSICKNLVKANDGEIEVQSEEGKGTTVRVALPLPAAMDKDKPVKTDESAHGNE
ncbi:MAG: PAS domain S-box protein, partial [Candidatus Omnitrophica bacterium]|nr:PAS domain S-box protein [Candidatus Omnitrophota bacterium]